MKEFTWKAGEKQVSLIFPDYSLVFQKKEKPGFFYMFMLTHLA